MSFPKRVLSALNYNEQKVQKGAAECIAAGGYLRGAGEMTFYQKHQGLERRNALNDRATTKTLHVSLNFDPSEKLSNETLGQIAAEYLMRIGFGEQPYLVYRHYDAGHPHVHVVSTTIRADGSRIRTHNLGRQASEKARRELEEYFGLIKAEGQQKTPEAVVKPAAITAACYGKGETKRSLAAVVGAVFNGYAFSSLPEYNAALRTFGVLADGGTEGSRIQRHGGLVYRILDERGEKVGVPVKASSLPGTPTLEKLRGRFAAGEKRKGAYRNPLKEKIDRCFSGGPSTLQELIAALEKEGVFTLPRRNGEGRLYGITFVDQNTRCVFNGSDLGKGYSAAGLQVRLADPALVHRKDRVNNKEGKQDVLTPAQPKAGARKEVPRVLPKEGILDKLLAPGPATENLPAGLLPRKKRKKKRPPLE